MLDCDTVCLYKSLTIKGDSQGGRGGGGRGRGGPPSQGAGVKRTLKLSIDAAQVCAAPVLVLGYVCMRSNCCTAASCCGSNATFHSVR
jgi:hypothetical protein